MKILFLGNSITLHAPSPTIGWEGNWGMAASAEENDYVHRLACALRKAGKRPEYRAVNVAALERDPEGAWPEIPKEYLNYGAEILVIRLGENVPREKRTAFTERLGDLIRDFRKSGTRRIFLTGTFWSDGEMEKDLRVLAEATDAAYVDLAGLQNEKWQAAGEFAHEGVARHPSDRGMQAIADLILGAMRKEGVLDAVRIPTFPEGEEIYGECRVMLDGKEAPCYTARVSAIPFNTVWPGHQRPVAQTELAPFVRFDLTGEADIAVRVPFLPKEAVVRPLSRKVRTEIEGDEVFFTLPGPGQYTLELDGRAHALHLFADPPEETLADPESATYYFGPGVHHRERIVLKDHESVYLAPGAVLYSEIEGIDSLAVGHDDIFFILDALGDPVVTADGLQPPALVFIRECDAVRFIGAVFFQQHA